MADYGTRRRSPALIRLPVLLLAATTVISQPPAVDLETAKAHVAAGRLDEAIGIYESLA